MPCPVLGVLYVQISQCGRRSFAVEDDNSVVGFTSGLSVSWLLRQNKSYWFHFKEEGHVGSDL